METKKSLQYFKIDLGVLLELKIEAMKCGDITGNWMTRFLYLLPAAHSASPGSGKSHSSMEAEGVGGIHDNSTSSLVRVLTDYSPSKSEVDMLHIKV